MCREFLQLLNLTDATNLEEKKYLIGITDELGRENAYT